MIKAQSEIINVPLINLAKEENTMELKTQKKKHYALALRSEKPF